MKMDMFQNVQSLLRPGAIKWLKAMMIGGRDGVVKKIYTCYNCQSIDATRNTTTIVALIN